MSSQLINQVLELTNAERAQAGLNPLSLDNQLAQAAQGHSDSMAVDDFFSHTGADGSNVSDRIQDTGYEYTRVGENIAAGQKTAEEVVQSWMDSPGHRANILNSDYTEIGIGYELLENDTGSVNYNHYWTQVFGTPQGNSSQPSTPVEANNDPMPVEDNSSNLPEADNSDSSTIENLDLGTDNSDSPETNNDPELAPQEVTELDNNDAPAVAEQNEADPIDSLDNDASDLQSSNDNTPIQENQDPLTNNVDPNLIQLETGDSTVPDANYDSDDLTGGSGNLTGGDNAVDFSGNIEESNNNQLNYDNSNYSADLGGLSENSWLGNSSFDSDSFEAMMIDNLSDLGLDSNQTRLMGEVLKSVF